MNFLLFYAFLHQNNKIFFCKFVKMGALSFVKRPMSLLFS